MEVIKTRERTRNHDNNLLIIIIIINTEMNK